MEQLILTKTWYIRKLILLIPLILRDFKFIKNKQWKVNVGTEEKYTKKEDASTFGAIVEILKTEVED